MKKRELVRKLRAAGFVERRASQRHELYECGEIRVSLGRHDTVKTHEHRDAEKAIKRVMERTEENEKAS